MDLVTPWHHAAASLDAREVRAFRARHAVLLEMIRRQRSPSLAELPVLQDWSVAMMHAANGELLEGLQATSERMNALGFRLPSQIVLAACGAPGGVVEVIPGGSSTVVLFLDRNPAVGAQRAAPLHRNADICIALTGAIAIHHRWSDPARGNPMARIAARGPWDKWAAAREVPLAEWIYAAGIGEHAGAMSASPVVSPHTASADVRRLRAAERELQARLDADLDATGIGLVLRWLEDDAPPAMRRCADGFVVPRGAGRYLGWRMLEERVARVGVLEAAVMGAS